MTSARTRLDTTGAANAEAADVEVHAAIDALGGRWDELLLATPAPSLFHRIEWLRAMEVESGTELVPLIASRHGAPAALLPVFVLRQAGSRLLFSPPPGCAVPELGPVLLDGGGFRTSAAAEEAYLATMTAFIEYIARVIRPHYSQITLERKLHDVRPFIWRGYAASPQYTYLLDLGPGPDALFEAFKRQTRTHAKRAAKYSDVEIVEGSEELFLQLVADVRQRYLDQGLQWQPSVGYLRRLHSAFGQKEIRVKALLSAGRLVTGLILLEERGQVRHWLGGLKPHIPITGANEYLHWEVIKEYCERGFSGYELMGANTPHLCAHKIKYGPIPRVYFRLHHASLGGSALFRLLGIPAVRNGVRRLRAAFTKPAASARENGRTRQV